MRILSVAAVLCVVLGACDSDTRPLPAAPTTPTVLPAGLVGVELTSDRPRRVVGLADVVTFTVIGNFVAAEPQPVPAALFFRPADAFEHTGRGSS